MQRDTDISSTGNVTEAMQTVTLIMYHKLIHAKESHPGHSQLAVPPPNVSISVPNTKNSCIVYI